MCAEFIFLITYNDMDDELHANQFYMYLHVFIKFNSHNWSTLLALLKHQRVFLSKHNMNINQSLYICCILCRSLLSIVYIVYIDILHYVPW